MPADSALMFHVYGLKNCDACRNTLKWLKEHSVRHECHDLRDKGLDATQLAEWLDSAHRPLLVNKRSTTWRGLTQVQKQQAQDEPLQLLLDNPTLLKRPLITDGNSLLEVGFSPARLEGYI